MIKRILCILLASALLSGTFVYAETENKPVEIFVSPSGNDSADGSVDAPFATLQRAKEEVRKYNQNMTSDIIVYFRQGTYHFDETVKFTPEDSGTNGYNVEYRSYNGEKVTLSGGRRIEDWEVYDSSKNIWSADADGLVSRQMFIDGERKPRAAAKESQIIQFKGIGDGEEEAAILTTDGKPPFFANYKNLTDIEIVWMASFSDYHMTVQGVEGDKILMPEAFIQGSGNPYRQGASRKVIKIENAYELLDEPGEWYLDRADGKVYYMLEGNEDINTKEVFLSNIETIIDVSGTANNHTHNIGFYGFDFSHTNWEGPDNPAFGYPNFQAGFTREFFPDYPNDDRFFPKAAVEGTYCSDIAFEGNRVAHCGGAGVWFKNGTSNIDIIGNEITDVSQNGIMVGLNVMRSFDGEEDTVANVIIKNNLVHNVGYEFIGAVGIFVGYTRFSEVSHNEIYDLPYSGISLGWGWRNHWTTDWDFSEDNDNAWKTNPNPAWKNKITNNEIYDIIKVADDGGAIYTLGINPHLEISGNYLHDSVEGRAKAACAIYLDNGNRFVTVTNNISHDIPVSLYVKGGDNVVTGNYFDDWYLGSRISTDQTKGWWEAGDYLNLIGTSEPNIIDNTVIKDGYFPVDIIANAGLEYEYQHMKVNGDKEENIARFAKANLLSEAGTTLKASSGKEADKALDGNEKTFARAISSGNWAYQLLLDSGRNVTGLTVKFETVPKKVKISYSIDGKEWTELGEFDGSDEITAEPNKIMRLLKLELLEGTMAVKEIEVFADDFIRTEVGEDLLSGLKRVTFMDIQGHWAKQSVEDLATLKVLFGVDSFRYLPDNYMTRAEWCAAFSRLLGYQKEPYESVFKDVIEGKWYVDYIQSCYSNGAYDTKLSGNEYFRPDENITREEAAVFIYNAGLELTSSEPVSEFKDMDTATPWAKTALKATADAKIFEGDNAGYINPKGNLTRAEAAVLLYKLLQYLQ